MPYWAAVASTSSAAKVRGVVQHILKTTTHASQPIKRLRDKALRPISDNSFFTHVATGRIILDSGIPTTDPY